MAVYRMKVWVMCLLVVLLSLPSGWGTVQAGADCQGTAFAIDMKWDTFKLPRTKETIDKLLKLAQDCPKEAEGFRYLAETIKAYQVEKAQAKKIEKKTVEKYEKSGFEPGGIRRGLN